MPVCVFVSKLKNRIASISAPLCAEGRHAASDAEKGCHRPCMKSCFDEACTCTHMHTIFTANVNVAGSVAQ